MYRRSRNIARLRKLENDEESLKFNLSSPEDFPSAFVERRHQDMTLNGMILTFVLLCSCKYGSRVPVSREDKIRQSGLAIILRRKG